MHDEFARGIASGIYKPMTKPCKRGGHVGARYVTGNGCVECVRGQAKRQYQEIRSCPTRWGEEKARLREMRI